MSFGTSDPQPTNATPTPGRFGTNLRTVRMQMRLSQARLAQEIRRAGHTLGEPNGCTKRVVQSYEHGLVLSPRPNYQRAIALVTGITYETLRTATPDTLPTPEGGEPLLPPFDPARLWKARYERGLSQQMLAEALAEAGAELGEPNGATKRLVQRWESGEMTTHKPKYQRALAHVFGFPYHQLCGHPDPSPATVRTRARVARPKASKKGRARELRALGLATPEIAQQLGISEGTARIYAPVGDRTRQRGLKPETIAEVRELYAQGITPTVINQRTGVSRAYISILTAHLRRQRPRFTQDTIDQIHAMTEQGLSQTEIAHKLGISPNTVRPHQAQLRIKAREATTRRARELRAQDWTTHAIARELHIAPSTVAKIAPAIDPIIKAAIRALAADGIPEAEIARRFNLSVETVQLHIRYAQAKTAAPKLPDPDTNR